MKFPKFLRPRFSLRTLVIVVTLACAYFPVWEITKKGAYRIEQTSDATIQRCYSPGPFILIQHELPGTVDGEGTPPPLSILVKQPRPARVYLWLFGWKVRLPIEWDRQPYTWSKADGKWKRSAPEDY